VTDEAIRAELALTAIDLERARERVVTSVQALRAEVVRAVDWREWVRRRPGTVLVAAFALGFLVGKKRHH
jgi:hypothetical protein